ncbi:MAG: tRNA (adenosine(37)-N6)-threonylcarbamoyltransferase complex ATPase subunit type 1 TsaE [Paracoccus sp. (in: a-proteobacteria)]|nr:tRNA (adenosine(37)-N6)-threonylcarbamoyltransferase complex ATPase subunit type 1 TsaE [Paracoccus sp. (in: a-proteobacteria)]
MSDALLTLCVDEAGLAAIGAALSRLARPGDTFLLQGPVGAGKSHLARAFIRANLGEGTEVPSPTFTLVQTYEAGEAEIWHADLYRLSDSAEVDELGLTDAIGSQICLIEWPDRLPDPVPDALVVDLAADTNPDLRRVTLHGGARWRSAARAAFVAAAGWGDAGLAPLAGDASARSYIRLTRAGDSAVLMDAPAGSLGPFIAMTDWLRERGFHAPRILAQEDASGLMLLEDFGDALMARVVGADPAQAAPLYSRVAGLLADLHRHAPPDFVAPMDGAAFEAQLAMFADHYAAEVGGQAAAAQVGPVVRALYDQLCGDVAPVVSLRDFHAENIVLTPDNRLGLLDYQDAVATHPAYDLVSLLHDARRDVDTETEAAAIARYLDASGADPDRFGAAYALLGAARNLRIMGIFARLCVQDGKPRYLDFMPRVWAHILRETAHPRLAALRELVVQVPAPDDAMIERFRARCPTR